MLRVGDSADPARRGPLTVEDPSSAAVEPSPEGDEESFVIADVIEEVDAGDEGDESDENDEQRGKSERPDQKDVVPGSHASSNDDALGVKG